jgi:hypothetical protein
VAATAITKPFSMAMEAEIEVLLTEKTEQMPLTLMKYSGWKSRLEIRPTLVDFGEAST